MSCFVASNVRFISARSDAYKTKPLDGSVKGCQKNKSIEAGTKIVNPVLKKKEFKRLINAAKVISIDERLEMLEKQERETQNLKNLDKLARQYFFQIDGERERKSYIEPNQTVVEGQEPLEVSCFAKKVDEIVSIVKHGAELLVQSGQRRDIERRQHEESEQCGKKHIKIMSKCLDKIEASTGKQAERTLKHAKELRAQIIHREYMRFLESERFEEEARQCREAAIAFKKEAERDARSALERKKRYRAELDNFVEMSNRYKKMICEQEQKDDIRIVDYLRQKQEQQRQLKEQENRSKEEIQRNKDHVFITLRKTMQANTYHRDVLFELEKERAARERIRQEEKEKKHREQLISDMKKSRQHQLEELKANRALQLARDENEYKMMIENCKKDDVPLEQQKKQSVAKQQACRNDLVKQWSEKVRENRRLKELESIETRAHMESEKKLKADFQRVCDAKLAVLRNTCQSHRIINEVDRQIKRLMKVGLQECRQ